MGIRDPDYAIKVTSPLQPNFLGFLIAGSNISYLQQIFEKPEIIQFHILGT